MRRLLIVLACALAVNVLAGFGGPANFGREGAGFGRPNVKGGSSSGVTCAGVIDASKGCPLPMLGM